MNCFILLVLVLLIVSLVSTNLEEIMTNALNKKLKVGTYSSGSLIKNYFLTRFQVENEQFESIFSRQSESVKSNAKLYLLGYQINELNQVENDPNHSVQIFLHMGYYFETKCKNLINENSKYENSEYKERLNKMINTFLAEPVMTFPLAQKYATTYLGLYLELRNAPFDIYEEKKLMQGPRLNTPRVTRDQVLQDYFSEVSISMSRDNVYPYTNYLNEITFTLIPFEQFHMCKKLRLPCKKDQNEKLQQSKQIVQSRHRFLPKTMFKYN